MATIAYHTKFKMYKNYRVKSNPPAPIFLSFITHFLYIYSEIVYAHINTHAYPSIEYRSSVYIYMYIYIYIYRFPSDGKESVCDIAELGSIRGSGRSPGERNGNSSSILFFYFNFLIEG